MDRQSNNNQNAQVAQHDPLLRVAELLVKINQRERIVELPQEGIDDESSQRSITPDEYKENKDRYDKEIARIQQQMNRLEEADNNFYLTATYLLQLFEHGDKLFEVANIEEKRESSSFRSTVRFTTITRGSTSISGGVTKVFCVCLLIGTTNDAL
jgi:hypothetical protein